MDLLIVSSDRDDALLLTVRRLQLDLGPRFLADSVDALSTTSDNGAAQFGGNRHLNNKLDQFDHTKTADPELKIPDCSWSTNLGGPDLISIGRSLLGRIRLEGCAHSTGTQHGSHVAGHRSSHLRRESAHRSSKRSTSVGGHRASRATTNRSTRSAGS